MNDYKRLLNYYKECFGLMDCFHFNSETTHDVYLTYLMPVDFEIIPITHSGIKDNRKKKHFDDAQLNIGFIGNSAPYKGLPLLKSVLKTIGKLDKWTLSVWGGATGKGSGGSIYYKGKFNKDTIGLVFEAMDVLVVPSIWKETFSLVALEALSYGVPVIVSNNVGAQDIVRRYDDRFVYSSENELIMLLENIMTDKRLLSNYNRIILSQDWEYDMSVHTKELIQKIYK